MKWHSILNGAAAGLAALMLAATCVDARALKWARTGDALTLDPHAQNESPTHNLMHQLYEPLLIRDHTGKLHPALAVSWTITDDPTVWEFKLRQGVKFHNGNPFNAEDVAFSLDRARQPTSDMKGLLTSIEAVTRVDDYTVRVKTKGPNPLLPNYLTNLFMMDKEWSEANNTVTVQDYKAKVDNFAVRNANGTGPYVLVSREQDVKTVLKRNEAYWGNGEAPLGITDITYTVIKSDATRVAALLSGEVDLVQDVPPQDIDRLAKTPNLKVNLGPENRTIFFGLDVASPELKTSNVKGKNPFADKRVRQAINMAIDREAIKRAVMRGQAVPAGIIAPPFVNGYPKELDALPKVDVAKAAALLKDAGYGDGFAVTLHCPNDRYINDEGICTAATAMLAKIGIKANLMAQPKGPHFSLIQRTPPETDFYLLGWGVPTYDSHYIFSFLYHTRSGSDGTWNATRFSHPEIDKAIGSLSSEVDAAKRNATIAKIWAALADEVNYVAIHHQMLAYAMARDLEVPVSPDNQIYVKFIAAK
ncbi:MAG TPA: ABC transporter substrate-binding protein [Hyphomicrobiaceae bacterium]|jgi:peptide/nickel transport system substrate-binding protein|nr:ABC transporter substrate-binding protein [Hyphomicrobiaceae bacterium]